MVTFSDCLQWGMVAGVIGLVVLIFIGISGGRRPVILLSQVHRHHPEMRAGELCPDCHGGGCGILKLKFIRYPRTGRSLKRCLPLNDKEKIVRYKVVRGKQKKPGNTYKRYLLLCPLCFSIFR